MDRLTEEEENLLEEGEIESAKHDKNDDVRVARGEAVCIIMDEHREQITQNVCSILAVKALKNGLTRK